MINVHCGATGQVVLFSDIAKYAEHFDDFEAFEDSFMNLMDDNLACWVYVSNEGLQKAVNISHCSSWVTSRSSVKARAFAQMVIDYVSPPVEEDDASSNWLDLL